MEIEQRKYEKNSISTENVNLSEHIESEKHFIYFVFSQQIKIKGKTEILSVYSDISFKEIEKEYEENEEETNDKNSLNFDIEETKLSAPKRKHALDFSSESDELFKETDSDIIDNTQPKSNNKKHIAHINFFTHLEGVMYEINDYTMDIPLNEFKELYKVFNNKESLNHEEFKSLVTNKVNLIDVDITQDDFEDIFKMGNIDLTIEEMFNNKDKLIIDKISITPNHIMFLLKRFGGNQALFYPTNNEENINHDIRHSVNMLTQAETTFEEFKNAFSLQG